ncbi:TPA_asm: RNA-directed RNA polymerase [ssRNA phage SRR5467139_2]|uniref:RNA-directed RNA polymerase n=1 Tax=ssRNA phage SRR5467139_2 TaxID=2786477 RepID=A0A8S5L1D6_9VIRU|nr:RNA-directed RNA polymerase [ssRNA phage SRR5467139_2]DAD50922.1 TPA_asm: RNA-directed RNA polymerase [ssRNA phage SRR5467139_2]
MDIVMSPEVAKLALKVYSALNTPRSLACAILLRYGEFRMLAGLQVIPNSYEPRLHDGSERFARDYQATELLRKYPGFPIHDLDLEAESVQRFYDSEKQCKLSNMRLAKHLDYPVFKNRLEWQANEYLIRAAKWLANTLGRVPDIRGKLGPGAIVEMTKWKRSRAAKLAGYTAYDKLHFLPATYDHTPPWVAQYFFWDTVWGREYLRCNSESNALPQVTADKYISIEKTALAMRGIAPGAGLMIYAQLAVGAALRPRLSRVGLDLSTDGGFNPDHPCEAQLRHQALACEGSVSDEIVTIDLSNASDINAYQLIRVLSQYAPDWWALLCDLRARRTTVPVVGATDGVQTREVFLEKFSAMGNGYTFELETLVFAALIHSVGGVVGIDSFVFGDDIIVPKAISRDLLALLRYCGHTPNIRKTYLTGYFRESCGGDFFEGRNVRPYYLKEVPTDATAWISIANGLYRASQRLGIHSLMAARNAALDNVPVDIRRCRGPLALGDVVVADENESTWQCVTRSNIRYLRVWRPVSRKQLFYLEQQVGKAKWWHQKADTSWGIYEYAVKHSRQRLAYGAHTALAAALMGLPSEGLAPRDSVSGYRFGRIAYS